LHAGCNRITEGNHGRRATAKKQVTGKQLTIVLRLGSEDQDPRSACRVEQTCELLLALELVVRLRKPVDEKR
jgi:hypothetical protein